MMKEMNEEKEVEGCTFAPEMISQKKTKVNAAQPRELSRFL